MHTPTVIETVVSAASSYDLIDLTTLKTLLAITTTTQDSYLALVISQVSAAAANSCNRVFPVETVVNSFWGQRDGYPVALRGSAQPLQLTRRPVQAITGTLTPNGSPPVPLGVTETISGTPTLLTLGVDYMVDASKGWLYRLDAQGYPTKWQNRAVAATFSGGFVTTPVDVVGAITAWVKAVQAAQTQNPALRSLRLPGVAEATYSVGGVPMPIETSSVLDSYKIINIG